MRIGWAFALLLAAAAPSPAQVQHPKVEKFVARPISWEGSATIHAGDQKIKIQVRTRIAANGDVVSESWPVEQGEQAMRRMTIDQWGGWIERGGKREPMPKEMLEHERQQFGFYTQLQKALAWREHLHVLSAPKLTVKGPVSTKFTFDFSLRPVNAKNEVSSPEPGGKPIRQVFYFGDLQNMDGFEWPRRIHIYQDGKLFFSLTFDKFEAGAVS